MITTNKNGTGVWGCQTVRIQIECYTVIQILPYLCCILQPLATHPSTNKHWTTTASHNGPSADHRNKHRLNTVEPSANRHSNQNKGTCTQQRTRDKMTPHNRNAGCCQCTNTVSMVLWSQIVAVYNIITQQSQHTYPLSRTTTHVCCHTTDNTHTAAADTHNPTQAQRCASHPHMTSRTHVLRPTLPIP